MNRIYPLRQVPAEHCHLLILDRYFARCWLNPQDVTRESRARVLETIRCRIDQLEGSLSSATVPSASAVSELGSSLPALFALDYPQVLTHGDLSRTNILVDEDTYEITGIVDWSLATILPFGMEIDSMFLTTGYMNRSGWHDYACCGRLREVFWGEFFSAIGVENVRQRDNIREMAERAARIGAILRYAFQRNPDGSPSRNLAPDGASTWKYLQAWITN